MKNDWNRHRRTDRVRQNCLQSRMGVAFQKKRDSIPLIDSSVGDSMSRPRNPALTKALAAIASSEVVSAAQAAKVYGVTRSSISRALKRPVCQCCGQTLPSEVHK